MTECGCVEACRLDGWDDQFQPATRELMVFTKSAKRFFDLDAVREALKQPESEGHSRIGGVKYQGTPGDGLSGGSQTGMARYEVNRSNPAGAPPLDWWLIPYDSPQPEQEPSNMTATFYVGDAIETMGKLPEASVDLVLSSPPFLALRSYLPSDHPDKALEGGSQATPGEYVDWLLDVVEACARVLAPHGSLCFELADTYSGGVGFQGTDDFAVSKGRQYWVTDSGTGPMREKTGDAWPLAKSLSLIPESFRFAMVYGHNPHTGRRTEPWRLRNVIRWVRPNPPVGALGDKFRPATSELMVFCKTKDRYFDLDAVREPFAFHTVRTEGLTRAGSEKFQNGVDRYGTLPVNEMTQSGAPPLDWWELDDDYNETPSNSPHRASRLGRDLGGSLLGSKVPEHPRSRLGLAAKEEVGDASGSDPGVPLDWWNIPLLEGEEPTPYGPKEKQRDNEVPMGQKRERARVDVGLSSGTNLERGTMILNPAGSPPLDWWNIPPSGYAGAHYAVWPPELLIKPIKAMCPEQVCRTCGEARRRIVENQVLDRFGQARATGSGWNEPDLRRKEQGHTSLAVTTLGFSDCGHNDYRPGLVLDPFAGTGTTLAVATGHGRDAIGIDLDERNYDLALDRVGPLILQRGTID